MDASQSQNLGSLPVSRRELLVVSIIVLAGFGLRFVYPERLAIEHFDEGVYASNVWFGDAKEKTYPEQHLYAPPLLPTLIECLFLASGPSNLVAILPGLVAGGLTPLALWWIGRSWFGPLTGCVAAVLCALSEVHILLSRSALTDTPLGLWWLLAIGTLHAACCSGRAMTAILAGGFVGLAWWTKYNGWMPLGIVVAGVMVQGFVLLSQRDPRAWTVIRRGLTSCLISAVTAAMIWSPWIWSLQSSGGYRAVMANHSRYVVGLPGWWSSLLRQIEQLEGVAGHLGTLSFMACCVLVWLRAKSPTRTGQPSDGDVELGLRQSNPSHSEVATAPGESGASQSGGMQFGGGLVIVPFALLAGVWPMVGIFCFALAGLFQWKYQPASGGAQRRRHLPRGLNFWILAIWFLGMAAVTPLYHPYLRLTVPLLLASFLGVGVCFQALFERGSIATGQAPMVSSPPLTRSADSSRSSSDWPASRVVLVALVSIPGLFALTRDLNSMVCHADRSGLVEVAREIKTAIEPQRAGADEPAPSPIVYVFAEPALLFQLRLVGVELVAPAGSLSFAESRWGNSQAPVYLAIGIHAVSDPAFQQQFAKLKDRLKPVGRWPWHLSPLLSLDQPNSQPSKLGTDPAESATVELFEVVGE